MKGSVRKSMTWLHTWSSISLGWILFAIFLTGTLSYFRVEISHWMKPEQHGSIPTEQTLTLATEHLSEIAPNAQNWTIGLPSIRSNVVELSWKNEGDTQRRRGAMEVLNASSGESVEVRETRGGDFLYRFHFELYSIPRDVARLIVEVATFAMFIALITGIIMHHKIFTDFFMFRTKNRALGWSDAHAVTAVLSLPFHLMITFSGLLFLSSSLLFWTGDTGHGGGGGGGERGQPRQEQQQVKQPEMAQRGEKRGENDGAGRERNAMVRDNPNGAASGRAHDDANGKARGENGRGQRPERGVPRAEGMRKRSERAAPVDMTMLVSKAQAQLDDEVGRVQINNPQTPNAQYLFYAANRDTLTGDRAGKSVAFDGRGNVVEAQEDNQFGNRNMGSSGWASSFSALLRTLHEARFADGVVRWLFFFAGVGGTLMVATGSILWSVKRAKKQAGQFGFELVKVLNIGSIAGLCAAVVVYFWLNRLIPASIEGRANLEIQGFFIAWAISIVHAIFFRNRQAWKWQLYVVGALFAAIPLLDQVTSPVSLFSYAGFADGLRVTFDVMCCLIGALLLATARYLGKHSTKSVTRAQRRPAKATSEVGA